jgi:cytochrome c oxidase subunit I+III
MNPIERHKAMTRIWANDPGWRGVFTSVNHTDIGKRLIIAAFGFFLIGGVLAMLIRAQIATPGSAFAGPEIYNQLFTMHGSIMMFLFAIPMFEGLAIYMLPKMLGARDLAYPRLSAYGWWCYLFGGSMLLLSMVLGLAPDSGWFMYTPLSSKPYSPGINSDFWLLGITFVEVSAIAAAVDITVSILKVRSPGMSLGKMPLFAWYMLVTAVMMLIGFPPLILGSVLLEVERAFGWPFFDAARGGDSLLWQHLFWLFGHPEVYIIFLPAAGAISTIIPVMARTKILGYGWIVGAILALGFLSFGLWVHHMFATGIPHMALAFFSAASTLVAVPTGVQIFAWLGTLWAGRPRMTLPMLYLIGFFVTFVMGGLTGVMVAVVPFDWQAHDTAFVTAHLHYVLMGGFVFPMLAATYYWLPQFTGRMGSPALGRLAFWIIFIGFHLTFLMMHFVGLLGMPRRIETYSADMGWTVWNLISSIGGFILAFGFGLFTIDVAMQILDGRRARRNPWGATTLEWAMPTPVPAYNFAAIPRVDDRDPLEKDPALGARIARGEGYVAVPRNGWRETMAVDTTTGAPDHVILLPTNTSLPIWTAAVTGLFFTGILIGQYWIAPLAAIGVACMGWKWAWALGSREDVGAVDIGCGERAPLHVEADEGPGWWGSVFLMSADGTFFASMLFGYAFLWTIAPNWPPPQLVQGNAVLLALGLGGAALAAAMARRLAARPMDSGAALGLSAAGLGALGLAFVWTLAFAAPDPRAHAYAGIVGVMAGYALVHVAIAGLMLAFVAARRRAGYVSQARRVEPRVAMLWTLYAAATGVVLLAAIHLPGMGA